MIPKLLAISGPLRGSEFPLQSGEFAIGRESSNAIWLEHSSVSRRHCAVRVEEGRYILSDIDSRNGTFVNNVPVKERELENGDEVRIGEYVFLFLAREPVAAPASAASPASSVTIASATRAPAFMPSFNKGVPAASPTT